MRKSVENLATSKITGGRRHPLRIRRKYDIETLAKAMILIFSHQKRIEQIGIRPGEKMHEIHEWEEAGVTLPYSYYSREFYEKLVREIFIFQSSFAIIWIDIVTLVGYAVVLFLIILVAESLLHKHLINRFMRHHHKLHKQKQKKEKNDV